MTLHQAEMIMVRWMGDMNVKDKALSKELKERLGIDDNLGTTAKQTVMVWACLAKSRH